MIAPLGDRIADALYNVAAASDGFTASLWTCLVQLTRPWMSGEFLYMRNWHVPAFTRGQLSSGTGEGDTAPLGVIPIACVLIKDVSIKANWSDADRRNLPNASHLGVFSLLGRQGNFASNTSPHLTRSPVCSPLPRSASPCPCYHPADILLYALRLQVGAVLRPFADGAASAVM